MVLCVRCESLAQHLMNVAPSVDEGQYNPRKLTRHNANKNVEANEQKGSSPAEDGQTYSGQGDAVD